VENGPESVGAQMSRWWLASDTLWLLEETEEGKTELIDQVRNAPWYAQAVGLGPRVGDIVEWHSNGVKWGKAWEKCTAVRSHDATASGAPYHVLDGEGVTIVDDEKEES
jgi:hypothetical protein